jgi:mono/diheme cytochrome c family protein
VARGQLRDDEHLYTGKVNGEFAAEFPFAVSSADLTRGQDRYTIYCTPCHGQLGDGKGMVVQRGLRQAATYHQDRLRTVAPGYLYDVISNGFGAMQGYAEQVPPRDRWLIAAYVRALQLSQNAKVEDVPVADRGRLDAPAATGQPAH